LLVLQRRPLHHRSQCAVALVLAVDGTLRESYIKAANAINSEYERNRALAAVVKRATL